MLLLKTTPPAPAPAPRRSVPGPLAPAIPPRPPSGRPVSSIYPAGSGREEIDTRPKSGRERVLPPVPVEEEEPQDSDIYMSKYRRAGNIGSHYIIWRKSHKLGINNIGEILI